MKKFTNSIIAGATGFLAIIFLVLPAISTSYGPITISMSGFDYLEFAFKFDGNFWAGLFATSQLLIMIIAIVLIVAAVISLLCSLNVIKSEKVGSIINKVIFAFAIALLVANILSFVGLIGGELISNVGIGAIFNLIISVIALVLVILIPRLTNKKAQG